jgi:hypothetical protein
MLAAGATLALACWNIKRCATAITASVVVAVGGVTASWLTAHAVNHSPDLPVPGVAQFLWNFPIFRADLVAFAQSNPNQIVALVCLWLIFAAFPLFSIRLPIAQPYADRASYLWYYTAVAILAALAFTIALYQDRDAYRYIEPVLFLLVPFAVVFFGRIPALRGVLPVLAAIAFVMAGARIVHAGTILPGSITWKPDLADCMRLLQRKYNLYAGLADYWTARPLTLNSDEALQVDEIAPDGSLRYTTNDKYWYIRSMHDGVRPPQYRFIVMRGLDAFAIARRYGHPNRIATCNNTAIWIYDDPGRLYYILVTKNTLDVPMPDLPSRRALRR